MSTPEERLAAFKRRLDADFAPARNLMDELRAEADTVIERLERSQPMQPYPAMHGCTCPSAEVDNPSCPHHGLPTMDDQSMTTSAAGEAHGG